MKAIYMSWVQAVRGDCNSRFACRGTAPTWAVPQNDGENKQSDPEITQE